MDRDSMDVFIELEVTFALLRRFFVSRLFTSIFYLIYTATKEGYLKKNLNAPRPSASIIMDGGWAVSVFP